MRQMVTRVGRWMMVAVLVSSLMGSVAWADEEEDPARMQATLVEVGESHEGRLVEEEGLSTWNMVRLWEEMTLTVSLRVDPAPGEVTLEMSSATGEKVESVSAGDTMTLDLEAQLDRGIYYIQIRADQELDYRLRIE